MHEAVGNAVDRDPNGDRDDEPKPGNVESNGQGDADGRPEEHGVGVIRLPPCRVPSMVAAVKKCPDAVHDKAVREVGDWLHHQEGNHSNHQRHATEAIRFFRVENWSQRVAMEPERTSVVLV